MFLRKSLFNYFPKTECGTAKWLSLNWRHLMWGVCMRVCLGRAVRVSYSFKKNLSEKRGLQKFSGGIERDQ